MTHKIALTNIMEELVENKMEELMKLSNMCTCDRCRTDVAALALNKLPPRYVATDSGSAIARYEWMSTFQLQIMVTAEIQQAIEMVLKKPRHEHLSGSPTTPAPTT